MHSKECRNRQKLDALAKQDEIYLMWKHSFADCADAFREYADTQPEDIRNMLWGYAECGRLMQQRLVNLACKYMDFLRSTEEGAV